MSEFNNMGCTLYNRVVYNPPPWITNNIDAGVIPTSKIKLFNGPTPVHKFKVPELEACEITAYIKRDDLTSFDMSGNKVRKLEFLMADALDEDHSFDSVITIGGLQSNHARATAVAARQLGLEPYLILRTRDQPEDVNFVGNLLFNRCVVFHMLSLGMIKYFKDAKLLITYHLSYPLHLSFTSLLH